MTRPEASPGRGPAPLPAGFSIVFDPQTQFVGADVLFGGSPPRLLRLNPAGQRALAELRRGPVSSPAAGQLARRLTDTGLAQPRPPSACEAGAPGPARPDVTVVIPARDRPAHLDRCLSALGRDYPVIVVDDGSRQAGEIAGLCRRHGATLIRRPRSGGPGPARNDGLAQVCTRLVAFLDSDCEAGPEWITSLAAHFTDPLVAAVAPRVRPITGPGSAWPLPGGPRAARHGPAGGPGPAAHPVVLRADRGPAGPRPHWPRRACAARQEIPRPARVLSTLACATARTWTWCGGWPGSRLAGPLRPRRFGQPRRTRDLGPGAGTAVPLRKFGGSARAPAPGKVPPLVLQAWPAAAVAALLARRPVAALAAYGAGTGQLVRLLHGWDVPPGGCSGRWPILVLQTWLGTGRWTIQYALPVAAAALARPGGRTARTRLGRRLAVASLLAGPPLADGGGLARHRCRLPRSASATWPTRRPTVRASTGRAAERLQPGATPVAWRPLAKPAAPAGFDPGKDLR